MNDKLLRINTNKRDDTYADNYNYPYEAVGYDVLKRIIDANWVDKDDILVDCGCGLGRVCFVFSYYYKCKCIGIELIKKFYQEACNNLKQYPYQNDISFVNSDILCYELKDETCFFFFNPFSHIILVQFLNKIITSYEENPRDIKLIFYYPSNDYLNVLNYFTEFKLIEKINCSDLYNILDKREEILLFLLKK